MKKWIKSIWWSNCICLSLEPGCNVASCFALTVPTRQWKLNKALSQYFSIFYLVRVLKGRENMWREESIIQGERVAWFQNNGKWVWEASIHHSLINHKKLSTQNRIELWLLIICVTWNSSVTVRYWYTSDMGMVRLF